MRRGRIGGRVAASFRPVAPGLRRTRQRARLSRLRFPGPFPGVEANGIDHVHDRPVAMKISVVMAVYNGGAELAPTLDSILGQSEADFELIAVDNGSFDDTPAVLRHYAARDGRLRVIRQENAGLTAALIRGCAAASAEVIARHDCGDRSHPERFARQLALLRDGVVLA